MIVSRAPYRISFFGGGTDYPAWFAQNGGAVLATTIDKYCYITLRHLPPFFDYRSRVVWSKIEMVKDASDIEHPVVRAGLNYVGIDRGVEVHHVGDLPARSGIGSSSSFTVALLAALHALDGRMMSKRLLAEQAIHLEQDILAENVGVQDQIEVAFGGLNLIEIGKNGTFNVQPLVMPRQRLNGLEQRLMLFFTGISRMASQVAAATITAIRDRGKELTAMRELVDAARDTLVSGAPLSEFGALLHESWQLKRSLAKEIAPSFVDDIYARARAAGAVGGKLLGAGGGGFMVFYVEPERQAAVGAALGDLLQIPFRFEYQGAQILFYDPQDQAQAGE